MIFQSFGIGLLTRLHRRVGARRLPQNNSGSELIQAKRHPLYLPGICYELVNSASRSLSDNKSCHASLLWAGWRKR